MCGIAGYAGEGDEKVLCGMIAAIHHRGPNDRGVWREDGVGLAHARLAIIDLSPGGHQPMSNGRYTVTFNGEIYNYRELRGELSRYPFKTESDTETILAAFSEWGTRAPEKLSGMFAFALWDSRERSLTLARDRLGKKPLYWSRAGSTIVFGSELKALLAHPLVPRTIDPRSLAHYLAREYVPTPRSIYAGVEKLLPGHALVYKDGRVTVTPFWSPAVSPIAISEAEAQSRLDALLDRAVAERMIADVPLGVFLSGGIDSSTVAYYAARRSAQSIHTFSIGFREKSFDESSYARLVAARLGTDHHEEILSGKDALALVPEIATVFDEPVADASVLPTMLLSRFTREQATVALGGDGADELLLGYPTFLAETYAAYYARMPEMFRSLIRSLVDLLPPSVGYMGLDFKLRAFTRDFANDPLERHLRWLGSFSEDDLAVLLSPAVRESAAGVTKELAQMWREEFPRAAGLTALSHLYLRTYLMDQVLVKVDRASMRYALEVRAPFLAPSVVEYLLSLPSHVKYRGGRGKYLLRTLMRGRLPGEVLDRPKQGFAVPVAQWLREDLRPLATDVLSARNVGCSGLLEPKEVERLLSEHLSGKRNHGKKLWTLLVFQLWYDRWH